MRHQKKNKAQRAGYFAYAKLQHPKNPKIRVFQKVGFLEKSAYAAYKAAEKKYGKGTEIQVKGARLDLRPQHVKIVLGVQTVVYEEFRPGPKQQDYSCGSSRCGML